MTMDPRAFGPWDLRMQANSPFVYTEKELVTVFTAIAAGKSKARRVVIAASWRVTRGYTLPAILGFVIEGLPGTLLTVAADVEAVFTLTTNTQEIRGVSATFLASTGPSSLVSTASAGECTITGCFAGAAGGDAQAARLFVVESGGLCSRPRIIDNYVASSSLTHVPISGRIFSGIISRNRFIAFSTIEIGAGGSDNVIEGNTFLVGAIDTSASDGSNRLSTNVGTSSLTKTLHDDDIDSDEVFDLTHEGLVPAPGVATGKFLRDDGTWAAGGGGGSATWTETEIDFGATPVTEATFTVVDASVSGSSKVAVVQSGNPGTGRPDGDALFDSIDYAAKPAAGSFTLYARATGGVVGTRKVLYQVA